MRDLSHQNVSTKYQCRERYVGRTQESCEFQQGVLRVACFLLSPSAHTHTRPMRGSLRSAAAWSQPRSRRRDRGPHFPPQRFRPVINVIINAEARVALEEYQERMLCDPLGARLEEDSGRLFGLITTLQPGGWCEHFWRLACAISRCTHRKMFVGKKDVEKRQHLIADARQSIEQLKPPLPTVWLVSTEVLGRIETSPGSGGERPTIILATTDVKDCFRWMKTPRWMHPFFSLSTLTAHGAQCRRRLGRTVDWIRSSNLCRRTHVGVCVADELHMITIFWHSVSTRSFLPLTESRLGVRFVYADNLGIISCRRGDAAETQAEWSDKPEKRGLRLHKTEVTQDILEVPAMETRPQERRMQDGACEALEAPRRRSVAFTPCTCFYKPRCPDRNLAEMRSFAGLMLLNIASWDAESSRQADQSDVRSECIRVAEG